MQANYDLDGRKRFTKKKWRCINTAAIDAKFIGWNLYYEVVIETSNTVARNKVCNLPDLMRKRIAPPPFPKKRRERITIVKVQNS